MYKLVAVDLDGTLINSYGEITEHTKEVIQKVQQKGVKFILASGRPMDSVKTLSKELKTDKYFIAGNGAVIYDLENNEIIYEKYIPKQKLIQIAKVCEENNIFYNIYTETSVITQNLKYNVLYYFKENQKKEPDKQTNIIVVDNILEFIKNSEELKCLKITVCDENKYVFNSIIKKLRNIQNIEVLEVLHMSKKIIKQGTQEIPIEYFFTEISCSNVDKWQAIKYLLSILDINPEEVITIGDNINDMMMIQNAGIGVCMGQGSEMIKSVADMVTENNEEEGVAKALKKIFL